MAISHLGPFKFPGLIKRSETACSGFSTGHEVDYLEGGWTFIGRLREGSGRKCQWKETKNLIRTWLTLHVDEICEETLHQKTFTIHGAQGSWGILQATGIMYRDRLKSMHQVAWMLQASWAEVISNSSNEIHQTWCIDLSRSLYAVFRNIGWPRPSQKIPFSLWPAKYKHELCQECDTMDFLAHSSALGAVGLCGGMYIWSLLKFWTPSLPLVSTKSTQPHFHRSEIG